MFLILTATLGILSIIWIALTIWMIVDLVNFSKKKKEQTLVIGDVKRASILTAITSGIVGIILFFSVVKPAVKNDEKANSKANMFFWISIAATTVFQVVFGVVFAIVAINATTELVSNTVNTVKEESTKRETLNNTPNSSTTKKPSGNFSPAGGNFSINMPCENPLDKSTGEQKIYMCYDTTEGNVHMVSYLDNPVAISEFENFTNEEIINHMSDGMGIAGLDVSSNNFAVTEFKGMKAIEGGIEQNGASTHMLIAFTKKNSTTTRFYYIMTFAKDSATAKSIFTEFADSFETL